MIIDNEDIKGLLQIKDGMDNVVDILLLVVSRNDNNIGHLLHHGGKEFTFVQS